MGIIERKQKVFYKKTKRGNIIKVCLQYLYNYSCVF